LRWYALRLDQTRFAIFDTFADAQGRDEHLNGEIARQLFARASELFTSAPTVSLVDIVATKTSAW
jgi:quinol monooxygenase YgiN